MFGKLTAPTRRGALALAVIAGVAAIAGTGAAIAEDWPTRAVTLVVPYGPGASNDTFTRALANVLTRELGQPFIVENRAGAGGFVGANSVVNADPDGYTFLEIPNSVTAFKPILKKDLDPLVHLKPIGLLAQAPTAMVINADVPANTVEEFIAHAKANPDDVFYGYAGTGTTQHQHGELFNKLTGLDITGVSYKSSSDAQTDLVAGRLSVMFVTVASTLGQINSGQLKLLAYSNDKYPESAPKAPTMAEAGVDGFQGAQIFWSMFGPADLSDEIRDKMNAAMTAALEDPSFKEMMAKSGASPSGGPTSAFVELLEIEQANLAEFVKNVDLSKK